MLARALAVGLLAGVLAGALASAAQMVRVVPLILEAEVFEVADHPETAVDDATWSPEDGLGRATYTVLTNLLVGVGFGTHSSRASSGIAAIRSGGRAASVSLRDLRS